MALKMTNSELGDTSIVTLDGRILLGEESQALRERLKSLIAEGKKQIVLNMDNITYIDSAGLGILVAAHVSAKNRAHRSNSATWVVNSRKFYKSLSW
jgi:anti-sigma B factor antagonist